MILTKVDDDDEQHFERRRLKTTATNKQTTTTTTTSTTATKRHDNAITCTKSNRLFDSDHHHDHMTTRIDQNDDNQFLNLEHHLSRQEEESISKLNINNNNRTMNNHYRKNGLFFSSSFTYLLIIVFVIFNFSVVPIQSRKIPANQLESFCRSYPLHRSCMGIFAGGGKRSMDNIPSRPTNDQDDDDDDDQANVEDGSLSQNEDNIDLWEQILKDIQLKNSLRKSNDRKNYGNQQQYRHHKQQQPVADELENDEDTYGNLDDNINSNKHELEQEQLERIKTNLEKKILLYKLLKRLIAIRDAKQQQQQPIID